MNREDIIRMAREAGMLFEGHPIPVWLGDDSDLERFAALVAAAEREACAKMVDHIFKRGGGTYGDAIRSRGEVQP